jgi:hypothetical protein
MRREVITQATEEQDALEEVSDMVEEQTHVTTSTTKTLCMGIPTVANDLYVMSHIEPRYKGKSDTTSKYSGKEEPKQS